MTKLFKRIGKNKHLKIIILITADLIILTISFLCALLLRFDLEFSEIPKNYLHSSIQYLPINLITSIIIFYVFKMYHMILRYASYDELNKITMANIFSIVIHIIGISILFGRMPISYFIFGFGFQYGLTLLTRFAYRFILKEKHKREIRNFSSKLKNTMIIGAGSAGELIEKDISRTDKIEYNVLCFIDDAPEKWNQYIAGIPVVGGRNTIKENVEKYKIETILIAIPSATNEEKKEILNICKDTGCELKILPGIYQLVSGEVTTSNLRKVEIEDLLGRDPIILVDKENFKYIKNKTVLVTGGGGSIGSELCRQIAKLDPKLLIIFDIYENNAYEIENELKFTHPELNFITLIGSVRDFTRLKYIFNTYKPDTVYHAAAHKHVPLMEVSPTEAIKNNVIGTYYTALASLLYGTQRFLLISTDKAVNPTNIMGASKRIAEKIVQSLEYIKNEGKYELLPKVLVCRDGEKTLLFNPKDLSSVEGKFNTEFVAVRFGNVLGSNGSVIPLFKKQIENGGPVTVTHPDIIRYFMTIKEAVSLVLEAGSMAKGGEIFVLDMGDPVKIDDLARNLIRLSGMEPDKDIRIVYTGLRPGEKLYEEKLMAEEGLSKTDNKLIHIAKPVEFDEEEFYKIIEEMILKRELERSYIIECIEKLAPSYNRPKEENITQDLPMEKFLEEVNQN